MDLSRAGLDTHLQTHVRHWLADRTSQAELTLVDVATARNLTLCGVEQLLQQRISLSSQYIVPWVNRHLFIYIIMGPDSESDNPVSALLLSFLVQLS